MNNYRNSSDKSRITNLKVLQTYEERLDLCLSAGNLAWWEMELPSGKVIFNENKVKMLGFSSQEFTDVDYTAFMDLVHPRDYDQVMKAMQDHIDGKKEFYEVEYRIRTKTGEYKWFHDRGAIVSKDFKHNKMVIKGVVFDVTDRRRAEENLKKANESLEQKIRDRTRELEKINQQLVEQIAIRKNAEHDVL